MQQQIENRLVLNENSQRKNCQISDKMCDNQGWKDVGNVLFYLIWSKTLRADERQPCEQSFKCPQIVNLL